MTIYRHFETVKYSGFSRKSDSFFGALALINNAVPSGLRTLRLSVAGRLPSDASETDY